MVVFRMYVHHDLAALSDLGRRSKDRSDYTLEKALCKCVTSLTGCMFISRRLLTLITTTILVLPMPDDAAQCYTAKPPCHGLLRQPFNALTVTSSTIQQLVTPLHHVVEADQEYTVTFCRLTYNRLN